MTDRMNIFIYSKHLDEESIDKKTKGFHGYIIHGRLQ